MKYVHTKKQWVKWYEQKQQLMGKAYTEVSPFDFYRDMFPEGSIQIRGNMENDRGNAMVDVIAYYPNDKRFSRKYIMTGDLEALRYMNPLGETNELSRLCLCSPVTYYGVHKNNNMAHELYAVVLDLDYVGIQQLKNVMKQIRNGARCIPPNYIVNSGKGLHFYYLLDKPIPCYKYMLEQLTKFKAVLQDFTWNETSSLKPEKPDHGAITQAFRMVGSETKLGKDYIVRAYKVREEKWTIETLYYWVEQRAPSFLKECPLPQLRDPIETYRKRHPLTMAEAKKKYPDWNPYSESKKWTCKSDLYKWWIRQIKDNAVVGGRYYSVLALAAYGSKCDIPLKQIEKDALELVPFLDTLTDDETNHFTKADAKDALSFFRNNRKEVTYKLTRGRIEELSKITIKSSHRKKGERMKQKDHLRADFRVNDKGRPIINECKVNRELALQYMRENGEINGRPDKSKLVEEWRKEHPNGRKAACVRETGLSKPTVYKWWQNVCLCEPTPKI